jgi:transcriptional regulator with GAF, ATPase, and Fis domain
VSDDRNTNILVNVVPGTKGLLLIRILNGPLRGNEAILLGSEPFIIGSSFESTLRLPDPAVSRRHIELRNLGGTVQARDLASTNGSFFEGSRFTELTLGPGSVFRLGETDLQIVAPERSDPIMPSEAESFGPLLGRSRRMREIFAVLERAAKNEATVLVTGETGTGKEVVAEAIHQRSPRAAKPLVVVDCASIPANLIESELFGHVKGAYTNALTDRAGAFESADGGTIFLDEIGEMPALLQPRLLRALETRTVKRVGANEFRPVNVRVIAATNRNLEDEVRAGRFRVDLYFRLAVIRVNLPPLRARRDDIPLLSRHFIGELPPRGPGAPPLELSAEIQAALSSYDWPGNVRELRNVVHQAASLSSEGLSLALRLKAQNRETTEPEVEAHGGADGGEAGLIRASGAPGAPSEARGFETWFRLPYKEARRQAIEAFELAYAENAVRVAGGNVSKAAEASDVHRNVLHRILARKGGGE